MADNHINIEAERVFGSWWESEGQYIRAGGGDYEKSFAYGAWLAASRPAADGAALDLPTLPAAIEVGGEGWGWEDFQSWKTFTVEDMERYARDAIVHYQRKQGGEVAE